MPQRVWRGITDAGSSGNAGEVVAHRTCAQRLTVRSRKDQVLHASERHLGDLTALGLQGGLGHRNQRDTAPSMRRLRGAEGADASTLALAGRWRLVLELEDLLAHLDRRRFHVGPA